MGAQKQEKVEVKLIALDNIKVDHALQSRVATSVDYMKEFTEAMIRGEVFPAVVVFWDGKRYWLADGFHRHGAAKRAGRKDIRCDVKYGTRRDAMIYSAGANKKFSIPRTLEDKKKAAEMLFADEEWIKKSVSQICEYVGVCRASIDRWRGDFCRSNRIEIPETVSRSDGRNHPSRRPKSWGLQAGASPGCRTSLQSLEDKLNKRGFLFSRAGNKHGSGLGECLVSKDIVVVLADFRTDPSISSPVGYVLMNRRKYAAKGRAVVVCDVTPRCEATEIAKQLGVEFLTPEELIGSRKAEA